MKKLLIIGNITTTPYSLYCKQMNATQHLLSAANFKVFNPIEIIEEDAPSNLVFEKLRPYLLQADFVFFMSDWKQCPIASELHGIAKAYQVEIVYYQQMNELQWAS